MKLLFSNFFNLFFFGQYFLADPPPSQFQKKILRHADSHWKCITQVLCPNRYK